MECHETFERGSPWVWLVWPAAWCHGKTLVSISGRRWPGHGGKIVTTFDIQRGYTPGSTNIAGWKMDHLKMYFLLKNGDIPAIAMLTCQRVLLSKVLFKQWFFADVFGVSNFQISRVARVTLGKVTLLQTHRIHARPHGSFRISGALKWMVSWTLFLPILRVVLHKPYPYAWYRWVHPF